MTSNDRLFRRFGHIVQDEKVGTRQWLYCVSSTIIATERHEYRARIEVLDDGADLATRKAGRRASAQQSDYLKN